MVCVDPHDIPILAIVDSDLMASMPKSIAAATGMDALTHAVEGYITKAHNTMSDMFHMQAIKLIFKYLPAAVNEKPSFLQTQTPFVLTPCMFYCYIRGPVPKHTELFPLRQHNAAQEQKDADHPGQKRRGKQQRQQQPYAQAKADDRAAATLPLSHTHAPF